METIGRIRRKHFLEGKTIGEIAHDLKVPRSTLRRVLCSGETSFQYERSVQPRPKLRQWSAEVKRQLRFCDLLDRASLCLLDQIFKHHFSDLEFDDGCRGKLEFSSKPMRVHCALLWRIISRAEG